MAKTLAELPRKRGGVGRSEAFSYEEWLDGQIWQLAQGEDYECKSTSMLTNIRNAAKRRGKDLRTRNVEGGIVVQAFTPEPESNGAKPEAEPQVETPKAETPKAKPSRRTPTRKS